MLERWTKITMVRHFVCLFVFRRWWKGKERRREMVEALGVSAWWWAATSRTHARTHARTRLWCLTPLLGFIPVENNCGYHLFESDSEEEEEEVTEKKEVEEPTKKKSAFQVGGRQQQKKVWVSIQVEMNLATRVCQLAYNAWVTSSKTALKDLKKEKKTIKKEEKKRTKREMLKQQGQAVFYSECKCVQYACEHFRTKYQTDFSLFQTVPTVQLNLVSIARNWFIMKMLPIHWQRRKNTIKKMQIQYAIIAFYNMVSFFSFFSQAFLERSPVKRNWMKSRWTRREKTRKVNKSCSRRRGISVPRVFLLNQTELYAMHSWYRKHPAASHQHPEAALGLCPASAGRPDRRPQLILQRQPGHLQGAALRARFAQAAAEEGERNHRSKRCSSCVMIKRYIEQYCLLIFFWTPWWPTFCLPGQRGEPGEREAVLWELDVPSKHALLPRGPGRIPGSTSDPACWTLLPSRLRQAQKPRLQNLVGQQRLQVGSFFGLDFFFLSLHELDAEDVHCALNLQLHDRRDHAVLQAAHTGGTGRAPDSSAWSWPAQTAARENGENWPDLWDRTPFTKVGASVHVMHISTSPNRREQPW